MAFFIPLNCQGITRSHDVRLGQFPQRENNLLSRRNETFVFKAIPLRNGVQSGAIASTSRKGVGPGLRGIHRRKPEMDLVPEPMFNLGELSNEKIPHRYGRSGFFRRRYGPVFRDPVRYC